MKTLKQIKEEVYSEIGYKHCEITDEEIDEIAKRYADECAKEALRLASDINKLSNVVYESVEERQTLCSKGIAEDISEHILSENNLPKHR